MPQTLPERYELDPEPLGQGGFGAVYRAWDRVAARTVAIKVPLARLHADVGRELALELQAAARVRHPGLVQILDVSTGGPNGVYMVMEYADGGSMIDFIGTEPSWEEARQVIADLLDALAHAHAHGLVHRDIKPANVLLQSVPGQPPSPRLADFGLAKVLLADRDEYQSTRLVAGTLPYMAPEIFEGDVGALHASADLYALGVLLFELFGDEGLPWANGGYALVAQKLLRAPPALVVGAGRGVPEGLPNLVARLLAPMPAARPLLAADVAAELRRLDPAFPYPREPAPLDIAAAPSVLVHREPRLVGRGEALTSLQEAAGRAARGTLEVLRVDGPAGSGRTRLVQELSRSLQCAGRARTLRLGARELGLEAGLRHGVRRLWGLGRLEGEALERRVEAMPLPPNERARLYRWLEWDGQAEDWLAVADAVLRSEASRGLVVLHADGLNGEAVEGLGRLVRIAEVAPYGVLLVLDAPPIGTFAGADVVELKPLEAAHGAELLGELGVPEGERGRWLIEAAGLPAELVHAGRLVAAAKLRPTTSAAPKAGTAIDSVTRAPDLASFPAPQLLPARRLKDFVARSEARRRLLALIVLLPAPFRRSWLRQAWDREEALAPVLAAARFGGIVVGAEGGALRLDPGLVAAAKALGAPEDTAREAVARVLESPDEPEPVRLVAARLWTETGRHRRAFGLASGIGREAMERNGELGRAAWLIAREAALGLDARSRWTAFLESARTERSVGQLGRVRRLLDAPPPDPVPQDLALERALLEGSLLYLSNAEGAVAALESASSLAESGSVEERVRAAVLLGAARHRSGDLAGAEVDLRAALEQAPTPDLSVRAARRLAMVRWRRGDRREARTLLEDALSTVREDRLPFEGVVLRELGNLLLVSGESDAAETMLREALTRLSEGGFAADAATTRISLGELARSRGDHLTARREYKAAVALSRGLRNEGDLLASLVNLVMVECADRNLEEAGRRLAAIDRVLPGAQGHRLRPFIEGGRLAVAAGRGRWEEAARAVRSLADSGGLPADRDLLALVEQGAVALLAGAQVDASLEAFDLAMEIASDLEDDDAIERLQRHVASF